GAASVQAAASLPWPDTNERAFCACGGAADSAAARASPTATNMVVRFMESSLDWLHARVARAQAYLRGKPPSVRSLAGGTKRNAPGPIFRRMSAFGTSLHSPRRTILSPIGATTDID